MPYSVISFIFCLLPIDTTAFEDSLSLSIDFSPIIIPYWPFFHLFFCYVSLTSMLSDSKNNLYLIWKPFRYFGSDYPRFLLSC